MKAGEHLDASLRAALAQRRADALYRSRRILDGPQGPVIRVAGRDYLSFCSNDYLGLAAHPEVAAACRRGLTEYGTGSGAAHLITGHSRAHHALEEELAAFVGRPRALLFSTGYMANLGIASALTGRGDAVFEDRLNHASLLDAGLLSGARFARFAHTNSAQLGEKLAASTATRKLVLTDGVFSMDGDIAPLPELAQVCAQHQAWLVVDDAHGFGVLGKHGGGTLEHFALDLQSVPAMMGTLGKALGTFGAFVAGSEILIETLIQQARTYIYTTAMPAALAEATRAALRLLQTEPERRQQLQARITEFRNGARQLGLPLMESETPIQPLLVGEPERALTLSEALQAQDILVAAIRPPTVPAGTARLRVTLSAAHSEKQVDTLLQALEEIF